MTEQAFSAAITTPAAAEADHLFDNDARFDFTRPRRAAAASGPFLAGLALAAAWACFVAFLLGDAISGKTPTDAPIAGWAVALAALGAPIALMIGLVTAHLQRTRDAHTALTPLQNKLNEIMQAQVDHAAMIGRFNAAIEAQIALLHEGGKVGEEEISRMWRRLQEEKAALQIFAQTGISYTEQAERISQSVQQFDRTMQERLRQIEQAEDQLRQRFAGISAAADHAFNRLGALEGAAERMVGHHNVMSEAAATQHAALVDLFNRLAGAHQASAEAADLGTRKLSEQAQALDETALRLTARLHNLGGVIRDEQGALDQAGSAIAQRTAAMSDAATQAVQQWRGLITALQDSTNQSQQAGLRISERLQDSANLVHGAMQKLGDHSVTIEAMTGEAAARIGGHASDLLMALEHIRGECGQLPVVLSEAGLRLETAALSLGGRVEKATAMLGEGADHVTAVAESHQAGMARVMQDLRQAAGEADDLLQRCTRQLNDWQEEWRERQNTIGLEQQKCTAQMAATLAQLTVAGNNLANLRNGAAAIHQQFLGQMDIVDARAQNASAAIAGQCAILAQQLQSLAETAHRTETQISDSGGRLQQSAQEAAQEIERLAQRFQTAADDGQSLAQNRVQELQRLTEETGQLLRGFGANFDQQLRQLAEAGEAAVGTRDALVSVLAEGIMHTGQLQQRLGDSCQTAQVGIQTIAAQLQQLDGALQRHVDRLANGTHQAVALVRNAGEGWQGQAQELISTAQHVRGEMGAIASVMDDLLQKGAAMRANARNQAQDLAASLTGVLQRVEQANMALATDDSPRQTARATTAQS